MYYAVIHYMNNKTRVCFILTTCRFNNQLHHTFCCSILRFIWMPIITVSTFFPPKCIRNLIYAPGQVHLQYLPGNMGKQTIQLDFKHHLQWNEKSHTHAQRYRYVSSSVRTMSYEILTVYNTIKYDVAATFVISRA